MVPELFFIVSLDQVQSRFFFLCSPQNKGDDERLYFFFKVKFILIVKPHVRHRSTNSISRACLVKKRGLGIGVIWCHVLILYANFFTCVRPLNQCTSKKIKNKNIVQLNVRIRFEIVRRCKCFFSTAVYLYDPPAYMYGSCTGSFH